MAESTPTKSMLASLLQRNAKLAVKVGPREIFHNHRAAALIAAHSLGANASYRESGAKRKRTNLIASTLGTNRIIVRTRPSLRSSPRALGSREPLPVRRQRKA